MKNGAVKFEVDRIMFRAVYRAVNRGMGRTMYWDVDGAVALGELCDAVYWAVLPHKEPPHPGLGLYLGGVVR